MRTKAKWWFVLVGLGLSTSPSLADYSIVRNPGVFFLLVNQVDHTNSQGAIGNGIAAVIPIAPENTQVYDAARENAYDIEQFSLDNPGWSPSAHWDMTPGVGAVFLLDHYFVPGPYTFTFTGQPHPTVFPAKSPGEHLRGRQSPALGTWENIVGSSPCAGDRLFRLATGSAPISYRGMPAFAFFYRNGKWSPYPPQLDLGDGAVIWFV